MIKNNNLFEYNKKYLTTHKIRSFVRHQGRITKKQKYALKFEWNKIGINFIKKECNFIEIFQNFNKIIMEIGFGMGLSLISTAIKNPEINFLGIEVFSPGVGSCLSHIKSKNINNLKILHHDANDVLDFMIPNNSLSTIQLFFPDPWNKRKHNKRRIVQPFFVEKIYNKLIKNGVFHMATDCESYAKHTLTIFSNIYGFQNLSISGKYVTRPKTRPETKFEKRGIELGYTIYDIMFKKE